MKILIKILAATLLAFTVNAQAGLQTCTAGTGGSSATFGLDAATGAQCAEGNDTNSIDSTFELFGQTGWILSDKNENSNGDGTIEFAALPTNGNKSGAWEIDTLAGLTDIVITLKAGNGFGAFLLDLTVSTPLAGTWSSSKDLSHASIYYRGEPTEVPEPSALVLLGLGFLGISLFGRRARK